MKTKVLVVYLNFVLLSFEILSVLRIQKNMSVDPFGFVSSSKLNGPPAPSFVGASESQFDDPYADEMNDTSIQFAPSAIGSSIGNPFDKSIRYCKFGARCNRSDCRYSHLIGITGGRQCRYGLACRNKSTTCKFDHPSAEASRPEKEIQIDLLGPNGDQSVVPLATGGMTESMIHRNLVNYLGNRFAFPVPPAGQESHSRQSNDGVCRDSLIFEEGCTNLNCRLYHPPNQEMKQFHCVQQACKEAYEDAATRFEKLLEEILNQSTRTVSTSSQPIQGIDVEESVLLAIQRLENGDIHLEAAPDASASILLQIEQMEAPRTPRQRPQQPTVGPWTFHGR